MSSGTPTPPSRPSPIPPRASRRVLGSLNNPPPAALSRSPRNNTPPHRHPSPSASEVSLPASDLSLAATTNTSATPLTCPICAEEMMTLLQLNRHLDVQHTEVEEMEKDDITTWIKKRMLKAKQFQPLVVVERKLKGLDVFESNDAIARDGEFGPAANTTRMLNGNGNGGGDYGEKRDSDYYVTRQHWQPQRSDDRCADPLCSRPLGALNGCVNCRKCGRLFCEEHTMYQIKLSRSAQHEPVRGYWCRVCETCYKTREGYNDHNGVVRDSTEKFMEVRKGKVERRRLEIARLEKRLTKLTQLLVNPPPPNITSAISNTSRPHLQSTTSNFLKSALASTRLPNPLRDHRKSLEQSIVAWEDDSSVSSCPECLQSFHPLTQRKHHCRICGRIVCGDPRTGCSTEHTFDVAISDSSSPLTSSALTPTRIPNGVSPPTSTSEKPLVTTVSIRLCKTCATTLFAHTSFLSSLSSPPLIVRYYDTLTSYRNSLQSLLPRFQTLVTAAQSSPTPDNISTAEKAKKRILEALSKVEEIAKKVKDMEGLEGVGMILPKAVSLAALEWVRSREVEVRVAVGVLENVKREQAGKGLRARLRPNGAGHSRQSSVMSTTSVASAPSPLRNGVLSAGDGGVNGKMDREKREKELGEQIVVFEEQAYMLQGMLDEAKKMRRWDEVKVLFKSREELEGEVERVRSELEALGR
ncbi:hypothetical protein EX30DRAFT_362656 [Ascodesmis nigricans]|uniref:FYVE-type domain-containing protein n=1 Tax=Ascodesmis nigricans TaxID=341454 RepID=A0A4S2N2C4_9PEZI|nr:hypothetical protein EX30DRAFT_362656 [Ascodesmis nigricans]